MNKEELLAENIRIRNRLIDLQSATVSTPEEFNAQRLEYEKLNIQLQGVGMLLTSLTMDSQIANLP